MGDIGSKLAALSSVDASTTVSAGGSSYANSDSFDLGANSSPQALAVDTQLSITNAASTDGYDVEVYLQWSDDNSNWPDDGEGDLVDVWTDDTAGADLTLSKLKRNTPKARYGRYQFLNNNGTDDVTVGVEASLQKMQSA